MLIYRIDIAVVQQVQRFALLSDPGQRAGPGNDRPAKLQAMIFIADAVTIVHQQRIVSMA